VCNLRSSVAKAWLQIFHASVFTLGGTGQFQIIFQDGRAPSGLVLVASLSHVAIAKCIPILYALFTLKKPRMSGCQEIKSSSFLPEVLKFGIAVMSSSMKYFYSAAHSKSHPVARNHSPICNDISLALSEGGS
jgi:hypothetical protein